MDLWDPISDTLSQVVKVSNVDLNYDEAPRAERKRKPKNYDFPYELPVPYPKMKRPRTPKSPARVSTLQIKREESAYCQHQGCKRFGIGKQGKCILHGGKHPKKTYVYYCKEEGCYKRPAGKGGRCMRHGGKRTNRQVCKVEGCEKAPQGKEGRCISHGGKQNRRVCNVEGCEKYAQHWTDGQCTRHAKELMKLKK